MLRTIPSRVLSRTSAAAPVTARPTAAATLCRRARLISTTPRRAMPSPLPPVNPPLTTALPSDSFHLLPEAKKAGAAEDALFEQLVRDVESWWATPRFAGITRPYTAADVVRARGSQQQSYPSSTMARKLWNLIQERKAEGKPIHTLGAIDPIQMTQQAAHQEVLYVSGWACSSVLTTTNEVSPDFGDYPYNTVPNQVQRLAKAQSMHDRKHWDARRGMSAQERASTPYIDYLRPIIADGDTGHGGLTAVAKLAKLFAEAGAAAVHFEDQMHGGKKCGHLAGKVLVSTGEHINRLTAARMQWDIMGTENLVIARTDSESGRLINNNIDARDHEFILGLTDPSVAPLAGTLQAMEARGASPAEIDAYEAAFSRDHPLCTFDEAAVAHMKKHGVDPAPYEAAVEQDRDMSIWDRRSLARDVLGGGGGGGVPDVYWNWDAPRTREGYYHFRAGMRAATKRALAFAPHADLLWVETGDPSVSVCRQLGRAVRAAHPDKALVYNLSPSFNWMGHGFTEKTLRSFIWDIAQEGFVLQLVSLAGVHTNATATCELARAFKDDGMLAYVNLVQRKEKEIGCDVLTHQKWSGAAYMDRIVGAIQSGNSSSKSMGAGNTEGQFH